MICKATDWESAQEVEINMKFNICIPAFCSGVFWTGVSGDIAFTGLIDQHATKGILCDSRRSITTFLLVMIASAMFSSPETRLMVFAYTSGLSRLALIHVLLIEPTLIFAYTYIMIITLENHHVSMVRTFLKVHTRPRLAYALRCRGY
jgi:hypothetical protein